MRKLFLTLMVAFALIGSAITGAASFLTLNKFMEGVDYDKVAQTQAQLDKLKAEGVDLANNAEYADMVARIDALPSKASVTLTKVLSVFAILLALGLCAVSFKKHGLAVPVAVGLALVSVAMFFVTPDLKGGMAGPAPLKNLMMIAAGMLLLASGSSFMASQKAS